MKKLKAWPYNITDDGRVFNLKGVQLKPWISQSMFNKYLRVTLYKKGCRKHFRVHRLVAITYINNPNKKREVDHIDKDTFNNKVDNLRWVTSKENKTN